MHVEWLRVCVWNVLEMPAGHADTAAVQYLGEISAQRRKIKMQKKEVNDRSEVLE